MSNKLNELNELDETEILEDLLTDNEQSSDEFFGENEVENQEKLYQVAPEMAFTDWKKLDEWLDKHGLEQGFAFTITHSDKDKHDSFPRRRTYACTKGRAYVPRKEAHINEERDRGHHSGDCKFYINAYRRKRDNLVYITKINGEHNHPLVENINMVASRYRKLTPEMRDDVKLLATCGVRAGAIIEVLQVKYPDKFIYSRNIYNMVQTIRNQNNTSSDAGSMYLELMKQQQENPTFHVDACFEDADPAMVAAVSSTWTTTKHHFCLFHIRKNLEKHFLGKYGGEKWKEFFTAFCHARNSRVEFIFEEKWAVLLQKYDDAANYLQRHLYKCREAWALCFTHRAFNAGVQSTQRVESYNGIIKNNVNGSSSLMELERTIERLLIKEGRYAQLNDTIGKLPVSREEDYHDHYYKKIDIYCQRYLTPALLKLQRHEMNRSMHYRCCITNLENELEKQFTAEIPNGIFSEDMFDACVIELKQLIADLDMKRITELWRISSIDRKSEHFIILYDDAAHLCTCLTLINRGLVCRHFFALMLLSPNAKFHIGLISQRWYADALIMEGNSAFLNEPALSVCSNDKFDTVEYIMQMDFLHLESIRGSYVFTEEVRQEMTHKQQWGKGFGIMKKTLNLAIAAGRIDELYEIHARFAKEIEDEISEQVINGGNYNDFANTISNPIHVRKKGRKPKDLNQTNTTNKGKKRVISENFNQSKQDDSDRENQKKVYKRICTVLRDKSNEDNTDPGLDDGIGENSRSNIRKCRVCNQKGHNSRTCPNKKDEECIA
ncbi:unnamed protein product [Rhizophagus irregularis]|nr:unnamed protein product [Rhizophagus irregularis]